MEAGTAVSALVCNLPSSSGNEAKPASNSEAQTGGSGLGFARILKEVSQGASQATPGCEDSAAQAGDEVEEKTVGVKKDGIAVILVPELGFLPVLSGFLGEGCKKGALVGQGDRPIDPGAGAGQASALVGMDEGTWVFPGLVSAVREEQTVGNVNATVQGEAGAAGTGFSDLQQDSKEGTRPLIGERNPKLVASQGREADRTGWGKKDLLAGDRFILPKAGLLAGAKAETGEKVMVNVAPENTASPHKDLKGLILAETSRSKGVVESGAAQDTAVVNGNEALSLSPQASPVSFTGNGVEKLVSEAGSNNAPRMQDLVDQVVDKIDILKKPGQSEVQVVLKPEVLGKLTIKLTLENHQVTARFMVENHMVKQVMEANLPQLRAALEASGLKLDRAEVGYHYQYGGGQDFQGQSGFFHQRAPVFRQSYLDSGSELRTEGMEEVAHHYTSPWVVGEGMLDCVV